MYEIYLLCNVDKELNDEVKELLLKNPINDNCSYFFCKYSTLETIKVVDTDCKKWCRPLYQNEYMNMKVVYYFKVYAELLYTISRYRT